MSQRVWQPMKQEVKDTVRDYRDVLKEIVVEAGNRPVTTALKAYAVGVAAWATKHAPDMLEYQYQLVEASTDLGEVPDPIRRQSSQDHVSKRVQLLSLNQLDYLWLGPLSLVYKKETEERLKLFSATNTPWLRTISTFPSRVVDVGFNHKWLLLNAAMIDYDEPEDDDDGGDGAVREQNQPIDLARVLK